MLTTLTFIAVLATAVADWVAVAKGWRMIETLAKPATMVLLFGYLVQAGNQPSLPLICFGVGLIFSLLGDICILGSRGGFPNRWFLPGLAAFLLAHVAYIIGLNTLLGNSLSIWAIGIGILLALTTARVLKRVISGIREKGFQRLLVPVVTYAMVITIMLLSAFLTIYRVEWKAAAAGLVTLGAALFYFSDLILAWNMFVKPIRNGRLINMIAYHLGQIALITGAVIQFG